jgi:hypothetical protein
MDVCVRLFCVWVVLRAGSGLTTGLVTCPRSPTDFKNQETEKAAKAQQTDLCISLSTFSP